MYNKNTLTDVGPDRTWFIAVYWYFIGVDGDTAVNTLGVIGVAEYATKQWRANRK